MKGSTSLFIIQRFLFLSVIFVKVLIWQCIKLLSKNTYINVSRIHDNGKQGPETGIETSQIINIHVHFVYLSHVCQRSPSNALVGISIGV